MAIVTAERAPAPEPASAPVLGVVRTLAMARSGLEARLLEAARVVVAACCEELLSHKGFTSVDELTQAQRRKWRAEGKAAAVDELISCLGVTQSEAGDLVGISLAGGRIPALVVHALEQGWVTWWQVRMFWTRCKGMPVEEAELVALALFGPETDLAHPDRLDPDGTLAGAPWEHHSYRAALAAEATRVDGKDPAAERARRRAAHEARHVSLLVHEDGTATLTLTGDLIALIGAYTRIDRIARIMRKRGDSRTLSQLNFDIAGGLLVHGIIPVLEKDPDDLTDDDLELLHRVVTAQPGISVEVVVPFDSVTGSPACPSCRQGYPATGETAEVAEATPPTTDEAPETTTGHADDPDVDEPPAWPPPGWAPPRPGGLAQIMGKHPAFLTPAHARELVCRPGTTMYRLLSDVRDGRLVERTQTTYRPDAAMRAQVYAADRFCRGPRLASRRPAAGCEIDHVIPYVADDTGRPVGGQTNLGNLILLAQHPHHRKTRDELVVEINARRDLTWTTLLAQTISTRSFDYRQFFETIRAEHGPESGTDQELAELYRRQAAEGYRDAAAELLHEHRGRAPGAAPPPAVRASDLTDDDRAFLREVAARALYAALVHRGPGSLLADSDDHPGATEHGGPLGGWMFVDRPAADGARRRGTAGSGYPTPEQVLRLPDPQTDDAESSSTEAPVTPWSLSDDDTPPPPF